MAIIYSYPEKTTPAGNDFLVITDSEQPAPNKNRTKSLTIDNLADYVVTSTSGITGSGTLNTIAMFTPDGQTIGDSIMVQTLIGANTYALDVGNSRITELSLSSDTVSATTVFATDLNGLNGGTVTLNGNTILGNAPTDTITVNGEISLLGTVKDSIGTLGTASQILVSNPSSQLEWTNIADIAGSVTGSGTTNTIPIWTDGPNGVLGDSIMGVQGGNIQFGDNSPNTQTQVGPGLITSANIAADVIVGIEGGTVTLRGDTVIGDNFDTPDVLTINAEVIDCNGDLATDGQLLVGNAQSQLEWKDPEEVVSGAIAKLIPTIIVASAGGSSTYSGDNNIVELQWTGGTGTYTLNVPSATAIPYRVIRFVTDGTFPGGASHKINITAQAGETIDGNPDFEISKVYEGVSIWSTGTEWIVIQAKAH